MSSESDEGAVSDKDLFEICHQRDPDDVRAMVGRLLAEWFGQDFGPDPDGDYALTGLHADLWIEIGSEMVRIWSPLPGEVADPEPILVELNRMNRVLPWKFYLEGGRIIAEAEVSTNPFVGRHFYDRVIALRNFMDGMTEDLAHSTSRSTDDQSSSELN